MDSSERNQPRQKRRDVNWPGMFMTLAGADKGKNSGKETQRCG